MAASAPSSGNQGVKSSSQEASLISVFPLSPSKECPTFMTPSTLLRYSTTLLAPSFYAEVKPVVAEPKVVSCTCQVLVLVDVAEELVLLVVGFLCSFFSSLKISAFSGLPQLELQIVSSVML